LAVFARLISWPSARIDDQTTAIADVFCQLRRLGWACEPQHRYHVVIHIIYCSVGIKVGALGFALLTPTYGLSAWTWSWQILSFFRFGCCWGSLRSPQPMVWVMVWAASWPWIHP